MTFRSHIILLVILLLNSFCVNSQTMPATTPISGASEVCQDEVTEYAVNTDLTIIINEVDFNGTTGNDIVEIKNVGSATVDISNWWICYRIMYDQLQNLDIISGSLNLAPGNIVTLKGFGNDLSNDSDLGLYSTDSFTSASAMKHFVKFGTTTSAVGRETVAVSASLWNSPTSGQYDIIASEAGKTVQFDGAGVVTSDWSSANSTMGSENASITSYNWLVPTGAAITSNEGNSISIDWSTASSGEIMVTETNGDGGTNIVNLAVTVNALMPWYIDSDGDGLGDPDSSPVMSCDEIPGRVSNSDDCNDNGNCAGAVDQAITFGEISNTDISSDPITLVANSDSGLPVSFSVTGPANLDGSTLTPTGIGVVTVTATQPGNNDFNAAAPISRSFCVKPNEPAIVFVNEQLTTGQEGIHTWFQDGEEIEGTITNSLKPSREGLYTVRITLNECTSDLSEAFQFLVTSFRVELENIISVFPTISSQSVNILSNETTSDVQLTVFDLAGNKYLQQNNIVLLPGKLRSLDITNLSSGVYVLRIAHKNTSSSHRFFKMD